MEEREAGRPGPSAPVACRGIRGATTVDSDDRDAVARATVDLLEAVVADNGCHLQDVAAAIFTLTDDLLAPEATHSPAAAARGHGWGSVPMLSVREQAGEDLVPRCLRVLVLWNTSKPQEQMRHVYLRGAAGLRPDLVAGVGQERGA